MAIVFTVFLFLLGMLFGSFASVCVLRIRSGEGGILMGRSHCPSCQHQLGWQDLIPVVSYLSTKGRCRYCKKGISSMYPFLELIMGALFTLVYIFVGDVGPWVLTLYFVVTWAFIAISLYDLLYLEIPDEISLPIIGLLLFTTSLWQVPVGVMDGLIGALIIVGFFLLQILVSRGKWMGLGDLRIGAMMGLFLGWQLALVALFLSYVVGSLISLVILAIRRSLSMNSEVPFGPFLTLGFFLAWFFGPALLGWYLSLLYL